MGGKKKKSGGGGKKKKSAKASVEFLDYNISVSKLFSKLIRISYKMKWIKMDG